MCLVTKSSLPLKHDVPHNSKHIKRMNDIKVKRNRFFWKQFFSGVPSQMHLLVSKRDLHAAQNAPHTSDRGHYCIIEPYWAYTHDAPMMAMASTAPRHPNQNSTPHTVGARDPTTDQQ